MPREEDIDPADIADLWEYCFLVHTNDVGKQGYNFTFLGKAIEDIYRHGLAADDDREPLFPSIDELAGQYHDVVIKSRPLITEGELTNPHGDRFKYRQVLLPLGEAGSVKAVFGGMRFLRVYSYA